jgi:hypothetical protein
MHLLYDRQDKIHWSNLSSNPNAMDLLYNNRDKICYMGLSTNPHPNAILLLEQSQNKINWFLFLSNPSIFELDYKKMAEQRTRTIMEDLMKTALHPLRIARMLDLGMEIEDL